MQVKGKASEVAWRNEGIDYLSFVPDGEPTLDVKIGKEISLLKHIGIPIAVLTNASLLWQEKVREDLLEADFVSLKVDAVSQNLWQSINRPHKNLKLKTILKGIEDFTETFKGTIVSETMLINVRYDDEFERIAEFLRKLDKLDKAYVAIPTRPPTEKWVKPAKEENVNRAFKTFSRKLGSDRVEYFIGYEGNAFAFTGDLKEDLLSIAAVHPMREEAVVEFLKKAGADGRVLDELLQKGELMEVEYEGKKYYVRKLQGR